MGLKRRQFYLSHLAAYFSDVHKRVMLAAPLLCVDSLFVESDIFCLLSDTQTSSSLRSQQALVDVASTCSCARHHRFSPARSPSRSSPSCRRHRESGSPARSSKRVRFDSPAPPSTLKPPNKGYPLVPYPHTYVALYNSHAKVTCNTHTHPKTRSC